MGLLRSERFSAAVLLVSAVAGLVLANTAIGPALVQARDTSLGIPGIGLDLSAGHWVSDGLLAVFFFIVAVELRRELVIGDLNSVGKAVLPAIAATGGVIVPAAIYLAMTAGSGLGHGWPVPTATDIAFALGVLAVFGSAIPTRVRVFLLALAVLDDLVAILIIAFFFTTQVAFADIGLAALTLTVFGALSRMLRSRSPWILARRSQWPIVLVLCLLGALTWYFVYRSGVHATIAGVALGLVISRRPGGRAVHAMEPFSNGVILPLFAFTAALVVIPAVTPAELSPAFWAILVALPVGKLVGITLAGGIGTLLVRRTAGIPLQLLDVATVAVLGGIGFTVSLLMNDLAFREHREVADEGTLAVLLGSGIAIVASATAVSLLSRRYRRLRQRAPERSPSGAG
ncbi:Na+/H+ antiporter NhaA [Rathayibacter sp. YIM 133350]|uniref:Na+/H+ antiporter NhaA n=1 Tax=Rathayibacter sp. YIM 133350 TaxID=3131992 RepID=UPI00307F882A